jgi:hypothetical protein
MEAELAPCGWCCPYWRPTVMVKWLSGVLCLSVLVTVLTRPICGATSDVLLVLCLTLLDFVVRLDSKGFWHLGQCS